MVAWVSRRQATERIRNLDCKLKGLPWRGMRKWDVLEEAKRTDKSVFSSASGMDDKKVFSS